MMREEQKKVYEKAIKDFKFFLFNLCYTKDFNDPKNSIKLFPKEPCYEDLADLIVRYPWTIVAKSRQIMATWFFCCELAWRIFRTGDIYAVVKSTKEAKSGWGTIKTDEDDEIFAIRGDKQSLLSRLYLILSKLPKYFGLEIIPASKPPGIIIRDLLKEKESHVKAGTQDPQELAGYTINHLIIDEGARQKDAHEAYTTIVPALTDNSIVRIFSTARGKEWFYATFYELDPQNVFADIEELPQKPPGIPSTIMCPIPADRQIYVTPGGIIYWEPKSPLNPFTKIIVHYSATRKGKDQEWVRRQKSRCLSQKAWNREYEISFEEIYEGDPVYPNFDKKKHVQRIEYNPELPVWRGWDFGRTGAVVWAQVCTKTNTVYVLYEYIMYNCLTQRLAEEVIKISHREFPGCPAWFDWIDPQSGISRSDKIHETNVDILRTFGIHPKWKSHKVHTRTTMISLLLDKNKIIIHPRCDNLIMGFAGGYIRDPKKGTPLEDGVYEHTQDALGYIIIGAFRNIRQTINKLLTIEKQETPPKEELILINNPIIKRRSHL